MKRAQTVEVNTQQLCELLTDILCCLVFKLLLRMFLLPGEEIAIVISCHLETRPAMPAARPRQLQTSGSG